MKTLRRLSLLTGLLASLAWIAPGWADSGSQVRSNFDALGVVGGSSNRGYIRFNNADGTCAGYLWIRVQGGQPYLVIGSCSAVDDTTTEITNTIAQGVVVGTQGAAGQ